MSNSGERYQELLSQLKALPTEPPPKAAPKPENIEDLATLPAAVSAIRSEKGKPFKIRESVAELVLGSLLNRGKLILGSDGHRFFFFEPKHTLYDVSSDIFEEFLAQHTGLVQTEKEIFDYVITQMHNKAGALGPTEVGAHSHVDLRTGTAYFANGPSGMFVRERGGEWRTTHNGDGYIFATSTRAESCTPDFTANGAALTALIDLGSISDNGGALTKDEQKTLLRTWFVFSQFSYRTRLILSAQGEPGSGKTSLCQNLCMVSDGGGFEVVLASSTTTAESTIVSLSNRDQLVLDNLDSRVKDLENILAVYATGGTLGEARTLFHNNRPYVKQRRTKLLFITSMSPKYNRDDVGERVIPIYFSKPAGGVLPETEFREMVLAWRHVVLGDLLSEVGRMADRLAYITPPLLGARMADFARFGWVMHARQNEGGKWRSPRWEQLLGKLKVAQDLWVARDSGLINTLYHFFRTNGNKIHRKPQRELYEVCREIAESRRTAFPHSPITFGKLLRAKREAIQTELGVELAIEEGHAGESFITVRLRQPSAVAGVGAVDGGLLAQLAADRSNDMPREAKF
jgi:hypothetical protein